MLACYVSAMPDRLDSGDIRLLQAYLRILGGYGNPDRVRGVDVVNGRFDTRTLNACTLLNEDRAFKAACMPTDELLEGVAKAYRRATKPAETETHPYRALAESFHARQHPHGRQIARLHPLLRHPLADALRDLTRHGVVVVLSDPKRSDADQASVVRQGYSTAAPGASFHRYGLAIDIVPRGEDGKESWDPKNPAWKTIIAALERHGFYSLYRHQGWDMPHFELPAKTAAMLKWPVDADGWKIVPASTVPPAWRRRNDRALADLEIEPPALPRALTPARRRG